MRVAYLDCFAGIAGDMFLGALVDAGVPRSVLQDATAALGLHASLTFKTVDRSGISATKVDVMEGKTSADTAADAVEEVRTSAGDLKAAFAPDDSFGHVHPHVHPHVRRSVDETSVEDLPEVHGRSLTDIWELLQGSSLGTEVKELALRTFNLLGHSEAKIHNVPVEQIHFHEVGAVDAIVDIVGASAGIVHLRIDAWHCSPVNVGGGTVRCAHGVFPVPAPATADLLRGLPTYSAHIQKELVTPTGAALLRALAPSFGPQPTMAVEQIGYGAGTRNPAGFANVLRLSVGASTEGHEAKPPADATAVRHDHGRHAHSGMTVSVLETALDDATPQLLAYVAERALQEGALDVMLTPVVMKKGRPGTLLTVLANPDDTQRFASLLLRETTTLGIRVREERRVCLQRGHTPVATPFGTVRVKTGSLDGETLNVNPEYEDCRRLAEEHKVPLKQVHAAAITAYAKHVEREAGA